MNGSHEGLKYGVAKTAKQAETLDFGSLGLGQRNPQDCPRPLGEPLTITDVAQLLGCSAWTVRQRYLRQGLPHLRTCATGKIVFFREQVIHWIELRQRQKGGMLR